MAAAPPPRIHAPVTDSALHGVVAAIESEYHGPLVPSVGSAPLSPTTSRAALLLSDGL